MSVKRQIVRALEDADVVKVKEIIDNKDNEAMLSDESMEIVASVCGYLTKETQEALPHLTTCCQETLITLAGLGNLAVHLVLVGIADGHTPGHHTSSAQHPAAILHSLAQLPPIGHASRDSPDEAAPD